MPRLRLVHWHAGEAHARAALLREGGHVVDADPLDAPGAMAALDADTPDAIVIDLNRLPSHGRSVGFALRTRRATRAVPLMFIEGDFAKTRRVRDLLPDASYTTWAGFERALKRALAKPTRGLVTPKSDSGGYSGTPLPRKLGIKEGAVVGLFGSPREIRMTLGPLPKGVVLKRQPRTRCDMVLCFATTRADLKRRFRAAARVCADSGLWLIWPKKSSGVASDLSEEFVRKFGLAAGWVDFKVCAIDATWSGHKFARRRG